MKSQPNQQVIDGREIADYLLQSLVPSVTKLKKKKIVPHLAVILVGDNQESLSYIKQKQKAGEKIKTKVTLHHFDKATNYQTLSQALNNLAHDPTVHGIIVQKPLPSSLSSHGLGTRIPLLKDVDGYLPKSTFPPPLGAATLALLKDTYFHKVMDRASVPKTPLYPPVFLKWLKSQKIVLMGRGETGGLPIADTLHAHNVPFIITNSQTVNLFEYTSCATIIISAVGKPGIVNSKLIKDGVILIGVGITKTDKGLLGDYDPKEIKDRVGFYTPTPGGVGPVNVACLIQNLVVATLEQSKKR